MVFQDWNDLDPHGTATEAARRLGPPSPTWTRLSKYGVAIRGDESVYGLLMPEHGRSAVERTEGPGVEGSPNSGRVAPVALGSALMDLPYLGVGFPTCWRVTASPGRS
ncbi:hypothetical protein GCM10010405_36400 [Streptomyces macrosporus]|uniref:Uncharacterized protein n=1 Tax=Streptomyces macrosporus TaxID=44032 RepID=A0ABP5XCT4_9ACTN